MSTVVISEFMDGAAVETLQGRHSVVYDAQLVDQRERLGAALEQASALIVRNRTRVDEALLACGPRLKVVGRLGVGLDNIDLAACKVRGVEVIPATGANNIAVAEYVVAAMLWLVRGCFADNAAMLAGEWPRQRLMGGEVLGRALGLVGFGGIAREVARRARVLGLEVQAFDPALGADDPLWAESGVRPASSLDSLLAGSDVVSVHVPLNERTRHLIGAGELAAMRDDAVLINTSRGGVVDDAALAQALSSGRLGGAALDVFEQEPLPAASVYSGVPNVLLTPHIAGVTRESNQRVSAMIADAVNRTLESTV